MDSNIIDIGNAQTALEVLVHPLSNAFHGFSRYYNLIFSNSLSLPFQSVKHEDEIVSLP